MPRVAIAGFQHETNTFAVAKSGLNEFKMADSWPELLFGDDVISGTAGINLPIAGFASAARSDPSVDLVPILWCAAEPSAHVTDDAFDRISAWILDGVRRAGPLDGIYFDLHGAMVTETYSDGEGELLRRIRELTGDTLPIAVSLDLHANITQSLFAYASSIAIYRTYPHLDMAETGERSFHQLRAQLDGLQYKKAFRQAPYLVPLPAQFTGWEPCRSLYAAVEQTSSLPVRSKDLALGFTASDIPDIGPSIVAYAEDQPTADLIADQLLDLFLTNEPQFDSKLLTPHAAVKAAMSITSDRPVVIADVQDNPGAGASSDTTGLLRALVDEQAQGAVVGLLHDPAVAAAAHAAGIGADIEGALGGRSGVPGEWPYIGRFRVEAVGSGACQYTGEMYGGGTAVLGPSTVLRVLDVQADVRIVVTSNRSQCLDLALFTHIGVDPRAAKIIVVKSTVHFRADFEPIAETIISAAAPGLFPCELEQVPYHELRDGVRLGPMGPAFSSG